MTQSRRQRTYDMPKIELLQQRLLLDGTPLSLQLGEAPPEDIQVQPLDDLAPSGMATLREYRVDSGWELDSYQYRDNPITFYIDVPGQAISAASLVLSVWDVDYSQGERDEVYLNGHRLTAPQAYLTGGDGEWSTCTFTVDPTWIVSGSNRIDISIDVTGSGWAVLCDWAKLVLETGDAGDNLSGALNLGTIAPGTMLSATDTVGDGSYGSRDVDLFKFSLSSVTTVSFDVDAQVNGSSLDGYMRLFTSSGQQLDAVDDVGASRDPYLSWTLAPGTYYVGISGFGNANYTPSVVNSGTSGSTGPYTLKVSASGGSGGGTWAPTIGVSAAHDGDPSPTVFGRYLIGSVVPSLTNTFSASVLASTGFTTSKVVFDSNFNGTRDAGDATDSTSGDGWTWNLNVSSLSGDKTFLVWAQESGGNWSAPATFSIRTLAAPSWMDPDLTELTFNPALDRYEIDTLIGMRFGEYTPASLPDWLEYRGGERTWNGVYSGIGVEAYVKLSGKVVTESVAPVLGMSFLGVDLPVKMNFGTSFSKTIDLFRLIDLCRDSEGYFASNEDPRSSGFYDKRKVAPTVTLSYDGHIALDDNLRFTQWNVTFGMELGASGTLFDVNLPSVKFPIPVCPALNISITPFIGWSPFASISYSMNLDTSFRPHFQSVAFEVGVSGTLGVTGELEVLGGMASGGVEVAASLSVAWRPVYDGSWSYSIPMTLGLDLDFVGSLLYGLYRGRINIYEAQWSFDLVSPQSFSSQAEGPFVSELMGPGDLLSVDASMGRSATGQMAYAWTVPSLVSGTSPLKVQRMINGVWQAPETVIGTDFNRCNPTLVSLGGDEWMVMWSQNNLPPSILESVTEETIVSQQEIWYARTQQGAWGTPTRLTRTSTCDDSPEMTALSDGRVLAVWRRMDGIEFVSGSSNLVWSIWDGSTWTAPALLADTGEQLSQPSVATLPGGGAVLAWMSDASDDGSLVSIWQASFDGSAWSSPSQLTQGDTARRNWPSVAVLADGRPVVMWSEETDEGMRVVTSVRDLASTWEMPQPATLWQALVAKPELIVAGTIAHVIYHGYSQTNGILGISRDYSDLSSSWSEPESLSPPDADAWWAFGEVDQSNDLHVRYVLDTDLANGWIVPSADLSLAPDQVWFDGCDYLMATITNSGWAVSVPSEVALYDGDPQAGGTFLHSEYVPSLAIGQSLQVALVYTPSHQLSQLWIIADPAGLISEVREDNNTVTYQFARPDTPTVVLDAGSDTGIQGDGRTVDDTPTIHGTTGAGTSVQVYLDGAGQLAQATVVGTEWTVVLPSLPNGQNLLMVRAYDQDGYASNDAWLEVFVDQATLRAPGPLALAAASDTGALSDDNLTRCVRPVVSGTAKPLALVEVRDGEDLLAQLTADADGVFSFTPGQNLNEGVHALTAVQYDDAGNCSVASDQLVLTIDTTPPRVASFGCDLEGSPASRSLYFGAYFTEDMQPGDAISQPGAVALLNNDGEPVSIWWETSNMYLDLLGADAHYLPNAQTYTIRFADSFTDFAGNALDGEFDGQTFPTGDGVEGGDFLTTVISAPSGSDIEVSGNSTPISSGDTSPSASDWTDFGTVGVGIAAAREFTVGNFGLSDLHLTGAPRVSISGPNAGDFEIVTEPGATVSALGSSGFVLSFVPQGRGLRQATITIESDDPDTSAYTFAVRGYGANVPEWIVGEPVYVGSGLYSVTVTAQTLMDGDLSAVEFTFSGLMHQNWSFPPSAGLPTPTITEAEQLLTLEERGQDSHLLLRPGDMAAVVQPPVEDRDPLTSRGSQLAATFALSLGAASMRVLPFAQIVVPAGQTVVLSGQCADSIGTCFDMSLTLTAPPPGEIEVAGNGAPILAGDMWPSTEDGTDFGMVAVVDGVVTQEFIIANLEQGELHLTGTPRVAITGPNSADFTVIPEPPETIAPFSASNFTIRFDPSDRGVRLATVTIASDDPDEGEYTFAVRGYGANVPEWIVGEPVYVGSGLYSFTVTAQTLMDGDLSAVEFAFSGPMGQKWLPPSVATPTLETASNLSPEDLLLDSHLLLQASDMAAVVQPPVEDRDPLTSRGSQLAATFALSLGAASMRVLPFAQIVVPAGQTVVLSGQCADSIGTCFDMSLSLTAPPPGEIEVRGNGLIISNGDDLPSSVDGTDFEEVALASAKAYQMFIIHSVGMANLDLSGDPIVVITGPDAGDFSVTLQPAHTVPSEGTTTFEICFDPSGLGIRHATVAISSNDQDDGVFEFSICGSCYVGGDANKDGMVDVGDLGIVAFNWMQSPRDWSQGNFTSPDTVVDVGDLGVLAFNWGYGVGQGSMAVASSEATTVGPPSESVIDDLPTVTRARPERSLPLASRPSRVWMSATVRDHRADALSLNALYSQARVPRRGLLWEDRADDLLDVLTLTE